MQLHEYNKPKTRKQRKSKSINKYNVTYKEIAKAFGYKNANSFNSSSAKMDVLRGIEWIIDRIETYKM
jgi:hypothetical protein